MSAMKDLLGDTPYDPNACMRIARDGSGFTHVCDRRDGHAGAHTAHWVDRDGVRRLGLSWTHEVDGFAVWPTAKGAISVVGRPRGRSAADPSRCTAISGAASIWPDPQHVGNEGS